MNNFPLVNEEKIIDELVINMNNNFTKSFNLKTIIKGQDITFTSGKVTYTLTSTKNQKYNRYNNETTINLNKCEEKLKEEYNISSNDFLYILKVDTNIDNMPKVEYEVYYPLSPNNLTILNLSLCKNIRIEISIPINISLNDLNKYNKSSAFYNDLCYTLTSEEGTDKPLKDRQNEFVNNNMSICEENCDFTEYDSFNKKAICSCFTKIKLPIISEIKVDKQKLFSNFKDIRNIANLKLIKCIHLLIDVHNIFKNAANYIIIILLLMRKATIAVFIFKDYKKIKHLMQQLKEGKNNIEKECINENMQLSEKKNNNKIFKENNKRSAQIINLDKNSNKNQNNNIIKINKIIKDRTIIKIKKNIKKGKKDRNKEIDIKNVKDKSELNLKDENIYFYNDQEMNHLDYESAKKSDKRNYSQYYLSLLRTKHILILTFFNFRDYNSQSIKIYIFFYIFAINFLISSMFYSDSTIHKIYIDKGSFDFTYQLPIIIYTLLISSVLKGFLNFFGLYETNILDYKCDKNKNDDINNELYKIKGKIIIFFISSYILLFFVWIYLGCFCAVYKNTQIHLLKEVVISFAFSFISPFFIYLLPGIFRISSLKKKVNRPLLYKFSKCLQML